MDLIPADRRPRAPGDGAKIVLSSQERGWRGLEAEFLRIPAGLTFVPGTSSHRLGVHVRDPDMRSGQSRSSLLESHQRARTAAKAIR